MHRQYPDRPLLGVGAVIVDNGRILLARRTNPPMQGEWSIPGGLVESGETIKEAVIREVREETGLEIEPVQLVEVFERVLRDKEARVQYHFVLIDYLCRLLSGEARAGSDVSDLVWATADELESHSVAEETRRVIHKAISTI